MFLFTQKMPDTLAPYLVLPDFLRPIECQAILSCRGTVATPAVRSIVGDGVAQTSVVREDLRRSETQWVPWAANIDWLYKKIAAGVETANRVFGFNLSGFQDSLQLAHYRDIDEGCYGWHEDHEFLPGFAHRKLSVSIALNDGYEGGEFEFLRNGVVSELGQAGSMLVFPSFRTHQVRPVTKGERWSLVGWVSGPCFR